MLFDSGGDGGQASLASLVEKTFVMAAAGNSYQEGLKAFITVCKEAYENGYTVPALTMEVSFVPTKVIDPTRLIDWLIDPTRPID